MSSMPSESNKAIIKKLFNDILNRNNPSSISELVSEDYFEHDLYPGQIQGRIGVVQRLSVLFSAFPDAKYILEDLIADGDKVAVRWTMNGTHKRAFMDIKPTNKKITLTGIDIYEIKNEMVASHWDEADMFGLLNQLKAD